MLMLQVGAQL